MITFRHVKLVIIFSSLMFIFIGCTAATRSRMMVDGMKPMMEKMNIAVNQNPDVETVRRAMPASLVQLDGFIEVSPDNEDILLRASEAYSGYAFIFIEDTDKKRAAKLNKKARDYALRVLKHNTAFRDAMGKSNDEYMAALNTLTKEDARALFFATNSWLSWIGQSYHYDTTASADIARVILMMDKLLELDETFNYGAPHALTAAYYSAKPISAGGNPDKAKFHFEISDSKFLPWHYLYAKYYAVQNQDRKLFESTLNGIISAPVDLLPEKRFANEAVKLKAKHLLSQADILFNLENPDMAVFYYIMPDRIH
jgi:TRAP transporter TatT component family protein